ncbi:MAG: glycosyltransferase family 4 protein [Chlamydiae bacterium]|nr:glycosyltransferase family 4 protein [Chlamydiota bacterium]
MKTALIHDWLVSIAGGEQVLKSIYEIFPSPIFTLIKNEKGLKNSFFEDKEIFTSFIQKLPFGVKKYQSYLPLFPWAIEQFDLSKFEVIISSSHCAAKGVLTNLDQLHICYCHTPMRYAWDLYHQYLTEEKLHKGIKGRLAQFFLHYLRMWDYSSSARVDHFIANSKFVKRRIQKIYGKTAEVIYPPVRVSNFTLNPNKENFYLTASRLVPYKKIDLIVEAFSNMPDKKLIVIGDGPDMKKIKAKAKKNIEILGYQSDEVLKDYLGKAKAFVFAAVEDFGILPVESGASGTPVIALKKGGAIETVIENKTGVFFNEQTVNSIIDAVKNFESLDFDPKIIRHHAENFSEENFKTKFKNFIEQKLLEKQDF